MSRLNGTHKAAAAPVASFSFVDSPVYKELQASVFGALSSQMMALGGSYETTRPNRLRPNQNKIRGGSADSHRDPWTRDSLRRQCQDLERNSSLARGLVERLIDLVVGDGFGLQVKSSNEEWAEAARWIFNRICGEDEDGVPRPELLADLDLNDLWTLDVRGMSCLTDIACDALRRSCFDGDLGLVFLDTIQVQAIESERIQNPHRGLDSGLSGLPAGYPTNVGGPGGTGGSLNGPLNGPVGGSGSGVGGVGGWSPTANPIVGGVEMDHSGKPLRFHISTWTRMGTLANPSTVTVDAEYFALLVNPLRKVTGSTRGEPQLQAAVSRLEHLEAMDETVLVAARIQAAIAAFITLERPDLDTLNGPGETQTREEDATDERLEEIEKGLIKRLGINEKVTFPPPAQPGAQHQTYVMMQILIVCAELGLPLPVGMLDGRQVNLSTIRCITQVAVKRFERLQKWLKRELYCRIYRFVIAGCIRKGLLPFDPQWDACEWMAPPPPVMDPMVDLAEARGLIEGRLMSAERVVRTKYGIDKKSEDEVIEKEVKDAQARGIAPLSQPGSGGPSGGPGAPSARGGVSGAADTSGDTAPESADDDAGEDVTKEEESAD